MLLAFHATGDGGRIIDTQPAADADILAAYALLRYRGTDAADLHHQGRLLASAILAKETISLGGTPVILPGPWARSPQPIVNPSYWMPPIFRWLAIAVGDSTWSRIASDSLSLVDQMTGGGRTLPPDWARLDGSNLTPTATPNGRAGVQYGLDAARLPLWLFDCSPLGHQLAARWWNDVLSKGNRTAADALTLGGEIIDPAVSPLPLLAAAAAALAAGDNSQSAELRVRADAQARRAPTYYGDAWLALGGVLLDRSLTKC
jgi:endoglucanase